MNEYDCDKWYTKKKKKIKIKHSYFMKMLWYRRILRLIRNNVCTFNRKIRFNSKLFSC